MSALGFDLARVNNNIVSVQSFQPEGASPFLQTLQRLQGIEVSLSDSELSERLDFDTVSDAQARLWAKMRATHDVPLPPPTQYSSSERVHIERQLISALELLDRVDHSLRTVVELLVGRILIGRIESIRSASIASSLGVIWLCPPPDWSTADYAEHLLHEATHQELLLDDMVNALFLLDRREMRESIDSHVKSTIRGTRRSYFVAFHAAVVALQLALFYDKLGDVQKRDGFVAALGEGFSELESGRQLLSVTGKDRLDRSVECFRSVA
ncbi:aKG-HExxH-type peptide beta-hydroxylase [Archangium violaceum]|uniref:aKG-HExxH-type peptide beta-hydroxylase n=1 Tax=Archangium violaceum TaxID=83451 RepID=UPI0036DB5418